MSTVTARTRGVVERLAEGEAKYGISTGFGALATVSIPPDRRQALQAALVRSHAAGMGDPVEREVVRAMVLLRARTLAMGFSGARPLVARAMLDLLNAGLTPVVPEFGSLGASGDLAPLAHAALALMGEGDVDDGRGRRPAGEALADAGLTPVVLAEKEGLAVTNGTDDAYIFESGQMVVYEYDEAADTGAFVGTGSLYDYDGQLQNFQALVGGE